MSLYHSTAFGQCQQCHSRYAIDDSGFCRGCRHVRDYKALDTTLKQVALAVRSTRGHQRMVRWPYETMDALGGPLITGQVSYAVANSGGGKTTFAYDVVRRWVEQGVGVTVLPLETRPNEWRMGLAATTVGVNPGDAWECIEMAKAGDPAAMVVRDRIEEALLMQADEHGPWAKLLHTINDDEVTVGGLDQAMAVARSLGHPIVLIDHIDHIGDDRDEVTGRRSSGVDASFAVNDALLKLAKLHDVHALAMSQANMSVTRGEKNRLMQYRPLGREHIMYPSKKVQNASQIWGLHRPLRRDITRETLELARAGAIDVQEALCQNRMGLNAIKLRHRGRNEGKHLELHFSGSVLRDLTAGEREDDLVAAKLAIPEPKQRRHNPVRDVISYMD